MFIANVTQPANALRLCFLQQTFQSTIFPTRSSNEEQLITQQATLLFATNKSVQQCFQIFTGFERTYSQKIGLFHAQVTQMCSRSRLILRTKRRCDTRARDSISENT
ncbi:hypothetical protein BJI67_13245 [Acidihalobacter aeolianus]|uniref:Uncharacterized protein n=1 Tax=Acidihalobacter aeolianus TaxID=2792603 RepID=A0A1D8KAB8_9GAMM|nr:hypothetical protein BJI67_13245 [Acidihalobacter aeolianus]